MKILLNLLLFYFSIFSQEILNDKNLSKKLSNIIGHSYQKISFEEIIDNLIIYLQSSDDKILFNKFTNYFSIKSKFIENDKILIRKYLYNQLLKTIELFKTDQKEALELLKSTKYLELVNDTVKNNFEICIKLIKFAYNFHFETSQLILDYVEPNKWGESLILQGHNGQICSLSWSPDSSKLVSGSYDGIIIWDVNSGELVSKVEPNLGNNKYCAEFSPDGSQIAFCSDGHIKILDLNNDKISNEFDNHLCSNLKWSPNGEFITGFGTSPIVIYNAKTGKPVRKLIGHAYVVAGVEWSIDSSKLVSVGTDNKVIIWDVVNEKQLFTCNVYDWIRTVCLSNNKIIFGDDTGIIRILDLNSGNLLNSYKHKPSNIAKKFSNYGNLSAICCLSCSPTCPSQIVVSTLFGYDLEIIDLENNKNLEVIKGHTSYIKVIKWSPCGNFIASGGDDNIIRIWRKTLN